MKFLDNGDLIRIPQDVRLWRTQKVVDQTNIELRTLKEQRYGLFNQKISHTTAEIILDGQAWLVDLEDIYEASNC